MLTGRLVNANYILIEGKEKGNVCVKLLLIIPIDCCEIDDFASHMHVICKFNQLNAFSL